MRLAIICFVIGIALVQQQATLLPVAILLSLGAALALFLWWLHRSSFIAPGRMMRSGLICFAMLACGWVWASAFAHYYLSEQLPTEWEQRDVRLVGTVDSLPHVTAQGTRFDFKVEKVLTEVANVQHFPSKLALSWFSTSSANSGANSSANSPVLDIRPGQRWRLTVRLKQPHGNANPYGFDYEAWLLEQDIRATGTVRNDAGAINNEKLSDFVWRIGNVVERSRTYLRDKINAALPQQKYASVIVALVVGDQRDVAQADWQIFTRTGIGHLISISGLHITMVAGMFAALMNFLWRRSFYVFNDLPLLLPAQKVAAISGAAMALVYVALAGFGVPAQRTLYMLTVVAIALWRGRLTSVSSILCLALGVTCLLDPWAVLSPGFWLSFGAVAVILFVSVGRVEGLPEDHSRARLARSFSLATRTQYAVTVGLVPLTVLLFGQVSVISPIANAVAIPLVSFIVTPLALAGSILPAPFSVMLLQLAHACIALLAEFLTYLSQLPMAVWTTPIPTVWMFAMAMLGTLWLLAPTGIALRWLGLVCWLPILCQHSSVPAAGQVTVTAFDVGQGMALLIETEHHRLLYDTGPAYGPESDGGNRVILPYLKARGITHLDQVLISHNDADHSGGALSLFANMPIDHVSSSLALDSPIVLAAPHHVRCQAGQSWDWDGVQFTILQPQAVSYDSDKWKPNARSCTLKMINGAHSMLLPGDIEAIQEDELINAIADQLPADVLLAPHHGSGTSSTPAFLQAVHPSIALFQVGYKNRYHHPKPDVFARYGALGINSLRTDESGAITLQFGTAIRYTEFRREHARYWYAH